MDSRLPLTPLSFQILVSLADGPKHGYGILKEIEEGSGGSLKSSTGTLYLAIQRLEAPDAIPEDLLGTLLDALLDALTRGKKQS